MNLFTRRDFLKTTALASVAISTASFDFKKYRPLLAFTTLGCPDWSFGKILNFADEYGYDGIELRGILRQLDLTKCPEFDSKENILASRRLIAQKKVKIIDLGTSARMHYANPAMRKKNLDEAKRFIQLAEQLSCPNIRLFPGDFPPEQERDETLDLIVKGLRELGDYASNTGVNVLLITDGGVVDSSNAIEQIMQGVGLPNVGLGWDVSNMWFNTNERPAGVYEKLKKYIRIIHVKDQKLVDGKRRCELMGDGGTPIFETLDAMAKDGFKGYYSFEWLKYYIPDLAEPEIALTDYAKVMKKHFKM